jgi:MEKHLA domain
MMLTVPSGENHFWVEHVALLRSSYASLTGKMLVDPALSNQEAAEWLFYAPFVVVSHNTAADPIFNYGNQKALELFEFSWAEFTAMPSRFSAEPVNQQARAEFLSVVSRQGFIDNYSGVRISKTGQRFQIEQATVWNLMDAVGQYCGQAAMFEHWRKVNY